MKLIKNDQELQDVTDRIDALWDAEEGTSEFEELEILCLLVDKYEEEHYPIPPSEPIEAIKFIMEQNNLTRTDLQPFIGGSGRVSEILNGKRELSIEVPMKPYTST